ncbi:hypothetical protein PtB15_11B220 [Puccinia triticina]|nr:hypothetical protein PtB15_11B220 [Puccinia triticina]
MNIVRKTLIDKAVEWDGLFATSELRFVACDSNDARRLASVPLKKKKTPSWIKYNYNSQSEVESDHAPKGQSFGTFKKTFPSPTLKSMASALAFALPSSLPGIVMPDIRSEGEKPKNHPANPLGPPLSILQSPQEAVPKKGLTLDFTAGVDESISEQHSGDAPESSAEILPPSASTSKAQVVHPNAHRVSLLTSSRRDSHHAQSRPDEGPSPDLASDNHEDSKSDSTVVNVRGDVARSSHSKESDSQWNKCAASDTDTTTNELDLPNDSRRMTLRKQRPKDPNISTLPRESGASGTLKSRAAPLLLPALDRSRLQRSPCTIPRSAPSNLQSPPTCSPARAQDMAQPQSENQILLPFHLLTNSILKPLDNTSNNTRNPALTLLDFIPKPSTPSSPSSTRPSSSSWAKFLILRQLESLRDFLQLTSLIGGLCHSNSSSTPSPPQIVISKLPLFRRVFAGKGAAHESLRTYCLLVFRWIPGVLSLDFAAYLALSPVTSAGYGCLLTLLLCEFYRVTNGAGRRPAFAQLKHAEGLDQTTQDSRDPSSDTTNTHWTGQTNELVHKQVPVTRICLEALVWANVYWSIPNVYIANADHPTTDVAEKLRSWTGEALVRPAEFCYRTTVRKDTPDAAGLVLFLAVLGLLALGCWFLLRLVNTIRASCPRTLPSRLNNTTNNKTGNHGPALSGRFAYFSYPYQQANPWATTRDIISRFVFKLVVIIIATVPVKDNCIFIKRGSTSRASIDLFRCLFLAVTFLVFWIYQSLWKPYRYKSLNLIHDMNINFCLFLSVVGTGSAVIHFQELLFGSILLIWTTLMYLLNIHYLAVHSTSVQRLVSSFNHTLASYSDGTRLLGMPEYRMAVGKRLRWREEVPGAPVLVNFDGTHAKRWVENVRLLEALGAEKYGRAAGQAGPRADPKALAIQRVVRSEFTGPDCFWKPRNAAELAGVTTFFGRADVVPCLFTVVFKYDQRPGDPVCICTPSDLRAFVAQNQNPQVQMRRKVSLFLRALGNKHVFAPVSVRWKAVQTTSNNRRWPRWLQGAWSDVQFRSI